MSFANQSFPNPPRFWTQTRVAVTFLIFAFVAVAASSCSRTGEVTSDVKTAGANANKAPTVTVQRGPALAEKSAVRPGAADALPAGALQEEIATLDGKTFRLADYAGKVVVLDIWATWCGPCRLEIPHLVELNNQYKSQGVEVIGLTIEDPESDAEAVRDFAREFNINYKLGWIEHDLYLTLTRGQNVIPQTFVIGRDGRLLRHIKGFNPQIVTILREAIERGVSSGA